MLSFAPTGTLRRRRRAAYLNLRQAAGLRETYINLRTVVFPWSASDGAALTVAVRWNKRRRTRFGFEFEPGGRVLVDVPPGAAVDDVRCLLRRHAAWLARRSRAAADANVYRPPEAYVDGAVLLHRGQRVTLRLGGGEVVWLLDAATLVAPAHGTKAAVWAWFAAEADFVLGQALADAAEGLDWLTGRPPWRHRYMSSRWGSCSNRGRITLNTHLVKLAPEVAAYVALHELCHLRHMDHGARFYALLAEHLPDWQRHRAELRRHGALLREPRPVEPQ